MNALVVYDSLYGNTEEIARTVGEALSPGTRLVRAGGVDPADLETVDLLVVGSPTHGGRPTEAVQGLLERLEGSLPAGTRVAAFDTRLGAKWVRIFGYAAAKIAAALEKAGGTRVAPAEGFVVRGKEGPLKDGERERATDWARELATSGSRE